MPRLAVEPFGPVVLAEVMRVTAGLKMTANTKKGDAVRLEVRSRQCKPREPGMTALLRRYPDTLIAKWVARQRNAGSQDAEEPCSGDFDRCALGLVLPYDGDSVVIHNCPYLIDGDPIEERDFGNSVVAMHCFPPFIYDVAEGCRAKMATEEGLEAIESNADWRDAFWEDYQ